MATTVSVSEETHRKMKNVKEKLSAESFDQLLNELMEKELDLPDTLMGEAEVDSDEVREHSDRTDRYE